MKRTTLILISAFILFCGFDKQDGMVKTFDEAGKLLTEETHKDGKKNGAYKRYDEKGDLREEGNYIDDKKEGLFIIYSNGKKFLETNWKAGKEEGSSKRYYEDGALYEVRSLKDGKLDGFSRKYYKTGETEVEILFKKGRFFGLYRKYDQKGNIEYEETRLNSRDPVMSGKSTAVREPAEMEEPAGTATALDFTFGPAAKLTDKEKDELIDGFFEKKFFDIRADDIMYVYAPEVTVLDVVEGKFINKPGKQKAVLFSVDQDSCEQCHDMFELKILGEGFKFPAEIAYRDDFDLGFNYFSRGKIKAVRMDPSDGLDQILIRSNLAPHGSGNISDHYTLIECDKTKFKILWQHLVEEKNSGNRGGDRGWYKAEVKYNNSTKQIEVSGKAEYKEEGTSKKYILDSKEVYKRNSLTGKFETVKNEPGKKYVDEFESEKPVEPVKPKAEEKALDVLEPEEEVTGEISLLEKERITKDNQKKLIAAVDILYSDNEGVWPDKELKSVVEKNKMKKIPKEWITGSNKIVNEFDGTGGWCYIYDPLSVFAGSIRLNVKGKDSKGGNYSSWGFSFTLGE